MVMTTRGYKKPDVNKKPKRRTFCGKPIRLLETTPWEAASIALTVLIGGAALITFCRTMGYVGLGKEYENLFRDLETILIFLSVALIIRSAIRIAIIPIIGEAKTWKVLFRRWVLDTPIGWCALYLLVAGISFLMACACVAFLPDGISIERGSGKVISNFIKMIILLTIATIPFFFAANSFILAGAGIFKIGYSLYRKNSNNVEESENDNIRSDAKIIAKSTRGARQPQYHKKGRESHGSKVKKQKWMTYLPPRFFDLPIKKTIVIFLSFVAFILVVCAGGGVVIAQLSHTVGFPNSVHTVLVSLPLILSLACSLPVLWYGMRVVLQPIIGDSKTWKELVQNRFYNLPLPQALVIGVMSAVVYAALSLATTYIELERREYAGFIVLMGWLVYCFCTLWLGCLISLLWTIARLFYLVYQWITGAWEDGEDDENNEDEDLYDDDDAPEEVPIVAVKLHETT